MTGALQGTILALVTAYVAGGVLCCLLVSRSESTRDWGVEEYVFLTLFWPKPILIAWWTWLRALFVALARAVTSVAHAKFIAAEVRLLTCLVRWSVRRLEARGLAVTMDREPVE